MRGSGVTGKNGMCPDVLKGRWRQGAGGAAVEFGWPPARIACVCVTGVCERSSMCVFGREREREREGKRGKERKRERERTYMGAQIILI